MKRIILVNRYFFPDISANSQLLTDLAFHLASVGRQVHAFTSRQLYENPWARLPPEEIVTGVHIHRLPTTQFGRAGLVGRSFDYLSFYASFWRSIRKHARTGDIVIASTDPPLMSVLIGRAKPYGVDLVNWLQDLYPEVAIELGVRFLRGQVAAGLASLRDQSLQAAAANVVVGQGMAERLVFRGIDSNCISIIQNWSNDEEILPLDRESNPLRREWRLEDKFVVGYSGNLGRAHEFETVLAAAERLKSNPNIIFLLIGGGYGMTEIMRQVSKRGLRETFLFIPYQERMELKYSLCVPDIHWISLKPGFEQLMVPSKFYGIAAAGRAIIAITAAHNEIARLIRSHKCGVVIEPGNADALVDAIILLAANRQRVDEMGLQARLMLASNFTRQRALARWVQLLDKIG